MSTWGYDGASHNMVLVLRTYLCTDMSRYMYVIDHDSAWPGESGDHTELPKSISETRLIHPDRRYPRQEGQSHRQPAHESTEQPPRGPGGSDDGVNTRRSRPSTPTVFASRVDLNPAGVKARTRHR